MRRPGMSPYEAAGFIRFKPLILRHGDELAQYRFGGERTVCLDTQLAAWAPIHESDSGWPDIHAKAIRYIVKELLDWV